MTQSLTQIYIHIIFHTKNRLTPILQDDQDKLYAYMAGIVTQNQSIPLAIGGTSDHIHVLCILSKNIPLYKLVQEIKQSSSRWVKTLGNYYRCFEWQSGYGAFSVSSSLINKTQKYINNQAEHHKRLSFKEEYLLFLKEYQIEYNEKYIWE